MPRVVRDTDTLGVDTRAALFWRSSKVTANRTCAEERTAARVTTRGPLGGAHEIGPPPVNTRWRWIGGAGALRSTHCIPSSPHMSRRHPAVDAGPRRGGVSHSDLNAAGLDHRHLSQRRAVHAGSR